jgi:hypothetical protein
LPVRRPKAERSPPLGRKHWARCAGSAPLLAFGFSAIDGRSAVAFNRLSVSTNRSDWLTNVQTSEGDASMIGSAAPVGNALRSSTAVTPSSAWNRPADEQLRRPGRVRRYPSPHRWPTGPGGRTCARAALSLLACASTSVAARQQDGPHILANAYMTLVTCPGNSLVAGVMVRG